MTYELPTTVTVGNRQFHIRNRGDFRMILDCFSALTDEKMSEDYRVLASLLIFYNEFNDFDDVTACRDIAVDLVKEMYRFINCGQDEAPGSNMHRSLIDWDKDSQIICAAVNNVAKQEIRSIEYLHWWTFMGYYISIGDSVMANVVSIRNKILTGKKLEKWEQEYKKENPQYFVWKTNTVEDREAEKLIREFWDEGG